MSEIALTWAILGHPADQDQQLWPVTICDTRGLRVRYQKIAKDALADLRLMGGMAKYRAIWLGDEWRLLEMVDDTETEAA